MTAKSPNLIERAAAQLLKSGNVDSSVASLLDQGKPSPPDSARMPEATVNLMPGSSFPQAPPALASGLEAIARIARPAVDPDAAVARPQTVPDLPISSLPVVKPTAVRLESLHYAAIDTPKPASGAAGRIAAPPPGEPAASPAVQLVGRTALDGAGLIDWEHSRSRVSEEFRVSQRQILRNAVSPETAGNGNGNLILITSSRPGEGKSFVALNLAASIARQGDHDVLLVDVDHKPDSLGTRLGLSDNRGLLDLMTDATLDPDQLIVRTSIDNLSILPIGRGGERSPELFASRQATRLIQSLGRRYAGRLVVLDAPPCLATSEPGALAPIVGQVVLVVEAEKTQREEVESALDLIQTCPTITLLLNKVQQNNRHGFGAYSAPYAQPYGL